MAAAGGAVAIIPVPPWTQIAGAGLAAVGAGMAIAAKLRERGSKALVGDEQAVAGFARRAARWSSAKRARVAKKLFAKVQRKKGRRQTVGRKTREALLELKLGVLYGLEHHARKVPKQRLVADDPETAPAAVEANPVHDGDDRTGWWIAGGLGLAAVAVLLSKRNG